MLVEFSSSVSEDVGRDIAMQVAAMNPPYVSSDQVPSSDLENEADILKKQTVLKGSLSKLLKNYPEPLHQNFIENCLVEQTFVKDPEKTIKDLLPAETAVKAFDRAAGWLIEEYFEELEQRVYHR